MGPTRDDWRIARIWARSWFLWWLGWGFTLGAPAIALIELFGAGDFSVGFLALLGIVFLIGLFCLRRLPPEAR